MPSEQCQHFADYINHKDFNATLDHSATEFCLSKDALFRFQFGHDYLHEENSNALYVVPPNDS